MVLRLEAARRVDGWRRVGRGARRGGRGGARHRAGHAQGRGDALSDIPARTRGSASADARAPSRGARGGSGSTRGGVVGVHCDAANAWCVSCGGDAPSSGGPSRTTGRGAPCRVDAACAVTAFARASDLLDVGLDGGAVLVVGRAAGDRAIRGGRVLRRLGTHAGRAARDLSWSATRQSLYAVCGRGALHRRDVASGACVDRVAFAEEAVAVSASPSGEFVATVHVSGAPSRSGRTRRPTAASTPRRWARTRRPRPCGRSRRGTCWTRAWTSRRRPTTRRRSPWTARPPPRGGGAARRRRARGRGAARQHPDVRGPGVLAGAHGDALRPATSRSARPVAPPKKPEAAPFFLPSEMDAQRRTPRRRRRCRRRRRRTTPSPATTGATPTGAAPTGRRGRRRRGVALPPGML